MFEILAHLVDLDRLSTTLLHSLWEGAAIALLVWAVMTLVRSPVIRYVVGCGGLLAMFAMPLMTYTIAGRPIATAPSPVPATPPAFAFEAAAPEVNDPASPATELGLTGRAGRAVAASSPWIAGGWLVGVGLVGLRHLIGVAAVTRLRRHATIVVQADLRRRLERVARRMKFKRSIALLASPAIESPCVVGWLRPAILWPACAMTGLTPIQLDALLSHELAHIRRHDYLVNLLQVCLETLGFYHPAVWWLSRRVRQEREHCCDDVAAAVVGDRHGYAETLMSLESSRRHLSLQIVPASGGSLMNRINRLLVPSRRRPVPHAMAVLLLSTAMVAIAIVSRSATAQSSTQPTTRGVLIELADTATLPTTLPTTPANLVYVLPNDLIEVTLADLNGTSQTQQLRKRVSESGKLSLPYIGQIDVRALNADELTDAIRAAYEKAGLKVGPVRAEVVEANAARSRVQHEAVPADATTRSTVESEFDAVRRTLAETESKLQAVQDALRMAQAAKERASRPRGTTWPDEAELARQDPFFEKVLEERDRLEITLMRMAPQYPPNHYTILKLRDQVGLLDRQIKAIAIDLAKGAEERLRGNYYIAGAVARPGVFSLDGNRVSVVQALIAAGYN